MTPSTEIERGSSAASFVGSLFRDSFVVAQQQQSNAAAPDSEAPNSVFFQFPLCSGVVPSARWAHSACLVGSLMFVYGGVGSSVMDDLWMLDIETMVWRAGSTTVSRPKDRPEKMLAHACAASGKTIWFFGGQQGRKFLREVYSLNTETMAWKLHSTDAPAARAGHSMTTVGPMEILTLGGQGKKLYNDLWLFNAGTVGWTELKPSGTPPSARRGQSAVWDGEDRLIVYGGTLANGGDSKVYIYSRSSNSWVTVTPTGEAPPTRTNHSAALLPGSGMVVFGGCSHQGVFYNDVWVLDIATWSWSRPNVLSNAPPPRYNHSCVLAGHKLVMYGGISSKQTFDGVVVMETKFGRDLNLVAEELARMSTTSSTPAAPNSQAGGQMTPTSTQNDMLKLQLQQLLVKRNMEERTQQVTRKAAQVEGKLLEEQEQREALHKEVLQLQLIIREVEEQKLQLESRMREADAKLHRDALVVEELRAELAAARRADAEKSEQLQEAHGIMDSMSKELGILSSRYTRTKLECEALQASRSRPQEQTSPRRQEAAAQEVQAEGSAAQQQEVAAAWRHSPDAPAAAHSCFRCQQLPCKCGSQQEQDTWYREDPGTSRQQPGSQAQQQEQQQAGPSWLLMRRQGSSSSSSEDATASGSEVQPLSPSASRSSNLQHYKHLWRSSEASRLALEARIAGAEGQLVEVSQQRSKLLLRVSRLEGSPEALGSCNLVELREVERVLENATRAIRDTIVERTIAEVQKRATLEHQSCFVCMEAPREVVFNCGHSCCAHCSIKLTSCPFCRQDISQKIKLFDA